MMGRGRRQSLADNKQPKKSKKKHETRSTNTRASARTLSGLLSSSLARCSRPLVHAKMEAMGLVEVLFPFWYSRQCRVTVPCAASDCKFKFVVETRFFSRQLPMCTCAYLPPCFGI